MCLFFSAAKVIKPIENIFKKLLAGNKNRCIFALGFEGTTTKEIITRF